MTKTEVGKRSICRYCGRQCTVKVGVGNVCRECLDAGFSVGR